jgi:hypothetical protein
MLVNAVGVVCTWQKQVSYDWCVYATASPGMLLPHAPARATFQVRQVGVLRGSVHCTGRQHHLFGCVSIWRLLPPSATLSEVTGAVMAAVEEGAGADTDGGGGGGGGSGTQRLMAAPGAAAAAGDAGSMSVNARVWAQLRRELVHRLAVGPSTFSELQVRHASTTSVTLY